ncbi:hypothetical protein [Alkalicoccus luteus]|uniref:hypothetical protein n=1 Tax=Alkalicoccus luteus TaxID=1237094 RepID=UPI00403479DA
MEKASIHPLILVSLGISVIAMVRLAVEQFSAQETGYGIVFALLALLLSGLIVYGIIRNVNMKNESKRLQDKSS